MLFCFSCSQDGLVLKLAASLPSSLSVKEVCAFLEHSARLHPGMHNVHSSLLTQVGLYEGFQFA